MKKSVIGQAGHKDNIQLQPGDVIYVSPVKQKKNGLQDILHELPYLPVEGAVRHGPRPPRLPRWRRS